MRNPIYEMNLATRGYLRRDRLKRVFEGRCAQIDAAKAVGHPPTPAEANAYGRAVVRYTRARAAWRAFRGWL